MSFQIDFSQLTSGLSRFENRSEAALSLYVDTAALKLQDYMRDNAPWTDRTGQARQRLTATAQRVDRGYRIALTQGVSYGVFLELAHEKRFAILQPTILSEGPEVMKGFEGLLWGLRK